MRYVGIAVAVIIAVLVLMAIRRQREMVSSLPPRFEMRSQLDASLAAGGTAVAVLGTGSMAPYIPPAKPGQDPLTTVVAYAVPSSRPFADIRKGDLIIYRPSWATGAVMHQAAQKDSRGWIMSGLNNPQSESFIRITEKEFVTVVSAVYVWTQ